MKSGGAAEEQIPLCGGALSEPLPVPCLLTGKEPECRENVVACGIDRDHLDTRAHLIFPRLIIFPLLFIS